MKYVVLESWQVDYTKSLEDAKKEVQNYYGRGGQNNQYIAQIVEAYEANVPVDVRVIKQDGIEAFFESKNGKVTGLPTPVQG